MEWPTPQDYNEALQLSDSFEDPNLRAGKPELNSLGLPKPITGAFASVYRIKGDGKDWAVKCFLHDVEGQCERYSQIGKFVHIDNLPYTIDFEYIERGVRIREDWFPILKMDWVEGPTINQYVAQNLKNPEKIAALAERFHQMTEHLHAAGIAHGDLQHGNMLVVNDEIVLVDYDGMFVPSLRGEKSNELGHRNYQHPKRTADDFGVYLDDFSEWSIYVSLKSISADPDLWFGFGADDDCLLFKQCDYKEPEKSRVLAALEYHCNEEVRALAKNFRLCMHKEVKDVPQLRTVFDEISRLPPLQIPTMANPIKQTRAISIDEEVKPREVAAGLAVAEEGLTLVVSDAEAEELLPAPVTVPSSVLVTHPKPLRVVGAASSGASSQGNGPVTSAVRSVSSAVDRQPLRLLWSLMLGFVVLISWLIMIPSHQISNSHSHTWVDNVMETATKGDMEFRKGNYQAASSDYKDALKNAYRVFGDYDPRTARIMLGLAQADYKLGDFQTAMGGAMTASTLYAGAYGYGAQSVEYLDCEVTRAESLMGMNDYVNAGDILLEELPKTDDRPHSRVTKLRERIIQDLKDNAAHIPGNTNAERSVLARTEQAVKAAAPATPSQP